MPKQPGFWSVEDRLRELSAQGDPLEKLQEIVDFELFRPVLDEATGAGDRSQGGRPPPLSSLLLPLFLCTRSLLFLAPPLPLPLSLSLLTNQVPLIKSINNSGTPADQLCVCVCERERERERET